VVAHVVRFANSDSNSQNHGRPRFNRFRRIVESAVQANRHVVESAQQEDEKLEAGTQFHSSAEIDLWKSASSDTAPWLFQLVFRSGDTTPPPPYRQPRQLHQASVVDESAETATRSSHAPSFEPVAVPERRPSSPDGKAMILWSRQTEPGLVVDRLLSSWTTLSPNQISLSSTRQHGVEGVVEDDSWREDILRMVEEAKKDDTETLSDWERDNDPVGSDDEAFQSAEEDSTIDANAPPYNFRSNTQKARTRSAKTGNRSDPRAYTYGSSPVYGKPPEPRHDAGEPHVTFGTSPTSRPHQRGSKKRRPTARPPLVKADSGASSSRVHTIHSDSMDSAFSAPSRDYFEGDYDRKKVRPEFSNPFRHIPPSINYEHSPPWQKSSHLPHPRVYPQEPPRQAFASDPHWPYPRSPPSPPPVADHIPPSPAPAPPQPASLVEIQNTAPENEAREDAVLAKVEKLLQKRNEEPRVEYEDAPFSRLAKILQDREVQSERERANATTEVYMKQMQDAHEKDEENLKRLESLVADQRAEQRRMEITWEKEKKTMEARAAKQAQEVKELATKEVAAAQLAKEAAQLALHVEKLETEKKARGTAEARAVEERKRTDEVHRLQLQRYEDLLRGLHEQHLNSEQDNDQPIRRTRIAEGNRSVDFTEYMASRHATPSTSSSPFMDSFVRTNIRPSRPNDQFWSHRATRRDSFRSSAASLHSSRTSFGSANTANANLKSQQMILFPVKADRRSQRMDKLQKSLARFGIESAFEDPEDLHSTHTSQLIQYNYDDTNDQIVRSTIFWEASALNLGSELLLTMRQAGWRPTYTRTSGDLPLLISHINALTVLRQRSDSLFRKSTGAYLLLRP
jgi:hypothetical protein